MINTTYSRLRAEFAPFNQLIVERVRPIRTPLQKFIDMNSLFQYDNDGERLTDVDTNLYSIVNLPNTISYVPKNSIYQNIVTLDDQCPDYRFIQVSNRENAIMNDRENIRVVKHKNVKETTALKNKLNMKRKARNMKSNSIFRNSLYDKKLRVPRKKLATDGTTTNNNATDDNNIISESEYEGEDEIEERQQQQQASTSSQRQQQQISVNDVDPKYGGVRNVKDLTGYEQLTYAIYTTLALDADQTRDDNNTPSPYDKIYSVLDFNQQLVQRVRAQDNPPLNDTTVAIKTIENIKANSPESDRFDASEATVTRVITLLNNFVSNYTPVMRTTNAM